MSFYNMEGAPFRYLRSVTTADSSGREQSRLPPSSARHRSGHVAAGLGPSGPRGPMRTSSGLAAGPRPTAQHQRVLLQTVATGGKRRPDGSTVLARALNLAPSTASKQADGLLCRQLCFDLTLRLHCSRAARATWRPGLSASAASDSPAASAAQADEGEEKEEEESPVGEQSGSPSGLAGLPVDQAALWAGERGPLWPGPPPQQVQVCFPLSAGGWFRARVGGRWAVAAPTCFQRRTGCHDASGPQRRQCLGGWHGIRATPRNVRKALVGSQASGRGTRTLSSGPAS